MKRDAMAAALEAPATTPVDEAALTAALGRAKAGALLDVSDMQAIFRIKGISTFFAHQKRGAFDCFRPPFPVGPARWSGALVWRYLEGLDVPEAPRRAFFGRRRKR